MDSKKQYKNWHFNLEKMSDDLSDATRYTMGGVFQQWKSSSSEISDSSSILQESGKSIKILDWFPLIKAGFDPNDLQLSKPCCGGGVGPGIFAVYGGGKWHDNDCDTLKPPPREDKSDIFGYYGEPNYRATGKKCECGAGHTANPNCHSTWCPEYKK